MTIYLSGCVRPEFLNRSDAGLMLQPGMGNRPDLSRTHFAIDNGCFSQGERFRLEWFEEYLELMDEWRKTCLFAVCPDVPRDAAATSEKARTLLPRLRSFGYPRAFVLQDGFEVVGLPPWDDFECLFVGGSSVQWKFSDSVLAVVREAKSRGKWTHQGRVNGGTRFAACRREGFDSADGTFREVWAGCEHAEGSPVAETSAGAADVIGMVGR